MTKLLLDKIDSPLGELILVVNGERVCALDYADYEERMKTLLRARYGDFEFVASTDPCGYRRRLHAYFAYDYHSLDEIPVVTGGTPFQQAVWVALRSIPPGAVATYGELAAQLGRPTAARAVGITNSLNPIAIVVPCHRVIGANADLTGYAGGLERKRWLLQHEGANLTKPSHSRQKPMVDPSFVQGSLFS